jgi:hypothetical protein
MVVVMEVVMMDMDVVLWSRKRSWILGRRRREAPSRGWCRRKVERWVIWDVWRTVAVAALAVELAQGSQRLRQLRERVGESAMDPESRGKEHSGVGVTGLRG